MKNIIILTIFLMALLNTNTNVNAQTGVYCPSYNQEQSNWCWAASAKMVYWNYKPGSINQCDAVNVSKSNEFNTGCNNLANSYTSACTSPSTFNNPQALYGCSGSLQSILSSYGISSTSYGSSLSASTVAANTSTKKIMIARWGWNNGGGHFVVINRYKNGNVYFNNPLSGSVIWSYNTFKTANGQGNWTHTLKMNSSAPYGSTYYKTANSSLTDSKDGIDTELSISLYPNPATEEVNILLNGEQNDDNQILITDAVGKVVFKQTYSKGKSSVSLDVNNWNRGIYFVIVNNNLSKKLILK